MPGAPRHRFLTIISILALAIAALAAAPTGARGRARAVAQFGAAPNVKQLVVKFAKQGVGSESASAGLTLSSTGSAPLDIFNIATSGDFSQTNNCGSVLPAGQACNILVTFGPSGLGARRGLLTVTSNAINSPLTVLLKGVGAAPKIDSLSATSLAPFAPLQILGSFLATSGQTSVVFAPKHGNPISVPVLQAGQGSVTVSVPPLLSSSNAGVSGGPARLQLGEHLPPGVFMSNRKGGLIVQGLTTPTVPPGSFTVTFLQAQINAIPPLQSAISGTALDSPAMQTALSNLQTALNEILGPLQAVVSGNAPSATLGTFNGTSLTIDSAGLGVADQMLGGAINAMATGNLTATRANLSGARVTPNVSGDCFQGKMQSLDACITQAIPCTAGDINAAMNDANGVPSCATQSVVQGVEVAGGAAGAALGAGELAGLEAALAEAQLLAVNLESGFGLMIIGSSAQNPSGAQQILAGANIINDQLKDLLLNSLLPKTTGALHDIYSGLAAMHDAITGAEQSTSPTPTSTATPAPTFSPTQTPAPTPTPSGCARGQTSCNGVCVDLNTDPGNCGSCGSTCAFGGACQAGVCGCPAGQSSCFNSAGQSSCVDTNTDNNNCGGCFNTCASGQSCSGGTCVNGCSGATPTNCSGTCTDTQTDSLNCGSCGNFCPNNERCQGGSCICYDPDATTDPGEDPDCE